MVYALLIVGLVLLAFGGEFLVRGAVGTASRAGVSPLLVGLTLVAFGTSAPELVASVEAALLNSPGIALGNVVGSNIVNILLILGISAVISSIATRPQSLYRDGTMMVLASLCLVAACLAGWIGRIAGSLLIVALFGYVAISYRAERIRSGFVVPSSAEWAPASAVPRSLLRAVVEVAIGILLVIAGAYLLVATAIVVARRFDVSETVIGLTIVAGGTSLPELVTATVAALRRHGDVALGTIVGSNVFNILGIVGVTALVRPIEVPQQIERFDIWVMLAATLLLVLLARTGWRLSRFEGVILLAGYGTYLWALMSPAGREVVGLP